MLRCLKLLPLMLALWLPTPAGAANSQATSDVSDLVSPLDVQALTPGPAWWRVSNGASTVWILGVPAQIPPTGKWDTSILQRRLGGAGQFLMPVVVPPAPAIANALTIPPMGHALYCSENNFYGADAQCQAWTSEFGYQKRVQEARFYVRELKLLDASSKHQALPGLSVNDLSAPVRERLLDLTRQALALHTKPPMSEKISLPKPTWSAAYATAQLIFVNLGLLNLTGQEVAVQLHDEAAAAKVRTSEVKFDPKPFLITYAEGPLAPQEACLVNVLETLGGPDLGRSKMQANFRAWANGDFNNAMFVMGCLESRVDAYRGVASATAPAIEALLARPGKNLAAVELLPLLMKGGVIDQLQTAGYKVEQIKSLGQVEQ